MRRWPAALALAFLAACAPPDDTDDAERLREYTVAVEVHCARLAADMPKDDAAAGLEVLRGARDAIRTVPVPPARAAEISRRFLDPLDRMIDLTSQAAGVQSAQPDEAVKLLDRADNEFKTMNGFFTEYGLEQCQDDRN